MGDAVGLQVGQSELSWEIKAMKNVVLCCLIAAGLGWRFADEVRANDELPNIVIIYADDLGFGDLSCYNEKAPYRDTTTGSDGGGGHSFHGRAQSIHDLFAFPVWALLWPTNLSVYWSRRRSVRGAGWTELFEARHAYDRGNVEEEGLSHGCLWEVARGTELVR